MPAILSLLLVAFSSTQAAPQFESESLRRVLREATKDPAWHSTEQTTSEKLLLIRRYALKNAVVSDPVSDRYVVTCYGGTIDLVHFLMLAAETCSGRHEMGPRLYQEWIAEGGPENLVGFTYRSPPEAHPDDLPSNALGALFGTELRKHENRSPADLPERIIAFLRPLKPVPDAIAKAFSHQEIVMRLSRTSTRAQKDDRKAWFTAAPLLHAGLINSAARRLWKGPIATIPTDGAKALKKAGFSVQKYKTRAIVIHRAARTD